MMQHYVGYLQVWFAGYFKEYSRLESSYEVFKPIIGRTLAMDHSLNFLAATFIPWVLHIYVFLAAGNLARRNRVDFAKVYKSKIVFLVWLFFAFTIEQCILARNISEFFYIGPTQLWCILLALIATLYRYVGVWSIWVLGGLSLLIFDINFGILDSALALENSLKVRIYLDAHMQIFLPTVCLGFIFGYLHFTDRKLSSVQVVIKKCLFFLSILLPIAWKLSGGSYSVPLDNVFGTEHTLSSEWLGRLAVLGFVYFICNMGLRFDKKFSNPSWPVLCWAGRQILAIYLIHKIFFVFLYMPIRNYIAIHTHLIPTVSIFEILTAVVLGLLFVKFVQATGLIRLLDRGE
jgi:hypothetical protein